MQVGDAQSRNKYNTNVVASGEQGLESFKAKSEAGPFAQLGFRTKKDFLSP